MEWAEVGEAPVMQVSAQGGTRVILVRHGESEGNRARRFTKTPAVPLTERGRDEARRVGERLCAEFDPVRILSSPFTRARQTAAIVAERLCLEVEVDPAWCEQNLGDLAGRSYDCVMEDPTFDSERRWAWRPAAGESLEDVRRRVAPAFQGLLEKSGPGDVVLVSHAGVMQSLWAHIDGDWRAAPLVSNTGILVVEWDGGVAPRIHQLP